MAGGRETMISKKKFYPLLFLAVLFSFAAGAYAADGIEKVEAYLRPDFRIELDELPVVLDPPPLLYEGRTYLPIRVISELLGAKIDWDQSTFTVKIVSPQSLSSEPADKSTQFPGYPTYSGPIYMEEKIRFGEILNYVMEYGDKEYEVLTNQYKGTMFFRLSDLDPILPDYNGLRIWEEEETALKFVLFSDLAEKLDQSPQFVKFVDGPIITGNLDDNQRRALLGPHRFAHYIRPLPGEPGYYEVLMSIDGEYYIRHVELIHRPGTTNGWISQQRKRIELYKEEDED
jgi:hypothetical protein